MNHDAEAVITFNQFQDNKHHIAGTGSQGQCYEAAHNVVLPYTEDHAHPVTGKPYGQDHLFDMHGGRDRVDQTNIAGKQLSIHHNTFIPAYNAINIRGEPQEAARIQYNWFVNQIEADAVIGEGNVQVASNWSGPAPTVD